MSTTTRGIPYPEDNDVSWEPRQWLEDIAEGADQAIDGHEGSSNPHPDSASESYADSAASSAVDDHESASDPHAQYLTSAPVDSVNGQTGVVDLDAADVGADPAGTADSEVSTHESAGDPHSQYATDAKVDGLDAGDVGAEPSGAVESHRTADVHEEPQPPQSHDHDHDSLPGATDSGHHLFSVMAFGAVGDGSNDDTSAVQAAFDAADGGVVVFPTGHYRITSTVTADLNNVRGIDGRNSIISIDGNFTGLHIQGEFESGTANPNNENAQDEKPRMNSFVRDLRVTSEDGESGTGIVVEESFGTRIVGCHLYDLNDGLEIRNYNRNLIIDASHIWHCQRWGIWFNDVNIHQVNIVGNHISYCRTAIYMSRESLDREIHDLQVVGNDIEASSAPGVVDHIIHCDQLWRLFGFVLVGNTIEDHGNCSGALILLDPEEDSGGEWLIASNHLSGGANGAIEIRRGDQAAIRGNLVSSMEGWFVHLDIDANFGFLSVHDNHTNGYAKNGHDAGLLKITADDVFVENLSVQNNQWANVWWKAIEIVTDVRVFLMQIIGNSISIGGTAPNFQSGDAVIHYDVGSGQYLRNAIISNNNLRGRGALDHAISIDAPELSRVLVAHNVAWGFSEEAFDIGTGSDVVVSDNIDG